MSESRLRTRGGRGRLRVLNGDPNAAVTAADYLRGWLASRQALRPSTALAYEIHLRRHLLPRLGDVPLARLSAEQIDALYRDLLIGGTGPAVSVSTVRRIHATLMSALNAAVRRGLLERNPARFVELPATWTRSTRAWDADEVAAFLDHVRADRFGALMVVLVMCGLRRGEALGLRWVDVDLDAGELRVEQQLVAVAADTYLGPPKSVHGRRRIALADVTVRALREHHQRQLRERAEVGDAWQATGLVFTDLWGRALVPGAVTRRFEQLVADSGLPSIRLHDLRHTSASLGMACGESLFEVSRRLGHSSIVITADVYGHLVATVTKDSADRLAALVAGPGGDRVPPA